MRKPGLCTQNTHVHIKLNTFIIVQAICNLQVAPCFQLKFRNVVKFYVDIRSIFHKFGRLKFMPIFKTFLLRPGHIIQTYGTHICICIHTYRHTVHTYYAHMHVHRYVRHRCTILKILQMMHISLYKTLLNITILTSTSSIHKY